MGGRFDDLKGRLLDAMDGFRDRTRGFGSRVRGLGRRRPNLDGMRDRLDERERRARRRRVGAVAAIAAIRDRLAERGGWLGAAGERMRPWHAVPGIVAALALIIGGFWLGGAIGAHAQAAALTSTVK